MFDGQVGGGPGSWKTGHGFLINGSTNGANQHIIVLGSGVSDIAILHTEAYGNYSSSANVNLVSGTLGLGANVHFSHCYFHDVFGVFFHMRNWAGPALVEYSMFDHNKSTAAVHSEGMSQAGCNDVTVRYNIWYRIEGTGVIAGIATGVSNRWKVYGNLMSQSTTPIKVVNDSSNNMQANNWEIYNNTITGMFAGISRGAIQIDAGSGNRIYNNLWWGNRVNSLAIDGTHDYNAFGNNVRQDVNTDLSSGAASAEAHGQRLTTNPFVNWPGLADGDPTLYDPRLIAPTQNGISLGSEFDSDYSGEIRGRDGVWDRGALEF